MGPNAFAYWLERFAEYEVANHGRETFAGREVLRFEDPEGQRLMLVDDENAGYTGEVWEGSDVPADYAIRGFYAAMLSVPALDRIDPLLSQVLQFRLARRAVFPGGGEVAIYETGEGGPGRELWVIEEPGKSFARLGAGGVHHIAFRVADDDQHRSWRERVMRAGLQVTPVIDRYYFRSIYFRVSNGILFEIATDEPGFATDEEPDRLGEKLALPPFLETQRETIEAGLKPIGVTSIYSEG